MSANAPMPTVLLNDFGRMWEFVKNAAEAALSEVGESGYWILGPRVAQFEKELAERWTLSHAVGCANGLDALEIALRVLGIGRGDKVATTPLSAFASTLAILRVGATPVFCDVDNKGLLDQMHFACSSFWTRFELGKAIRAENEIWAQGRRGLCSSDRCEI